MPGLFIQRHAAVAAGFANVSVIYLRAVPDMKYGYELIETNEFNCKTIRMYYGSRTSVPYPFIHLVRAFSFIIAFIKAYRYQCRNYWKPDIVHVNVLTRLGLLALFLKLLYKIPYVITEHWSRYLPITGTYRGFFRKVATRLVVKNANALSTVSKNLSNAMQLHGLDNDNVTLLPNVVDFDKYTISSKIEKSDIVQILHVSCFEDKSKNISGLLRVIKELSIKRSDFHVTMVGEGVDLVEMIAYADKLGLNSNQITFTGLLENEALINQYQNADFLIMFSNYENMPVVISEAFACGLPVLATSVGGIPEFVNNENGCLVAARDEKELLGECNRMIDSIRNFDNQNIRNNAATFFSEEAVADALKKLYSF